MNKFITLNLPCNIKTVVWSNSKNKELININIINNTKILKINVLKKNCFFDRWFNSLIINNNKIEKNNIRLSNLLNLFFKSWDKYFFNKIKFKGKGFRIKFYKKIKLIKFYFGKSHKTFYLLKKIKRKKINKYKFIITSLKKKNTIDISKKITNIKNINFYTLRGLRSSKQIIYKRKGKKGTYI